MIAGSVIFLVGAAVGVPGIFAEPDRETRLRMIEERLFLWRLAQPFYAIGPLVASAGVGYLAVGSTDSGGALLFWLSFLLLMIGALCWSWSVYLRTTRYREFALGGLPVWPFAGYVLLTLGGLALLGAGLLVAAFPGWVGWLTIGADALFLMVFLRQKDIPPFVFYLLLTVVGAAVL
jgi:hypothetical protein